MTQPPAVVTQSETRSLEEQQPDQAQESHQPPHLFSPIRFRSITLPNRIVVSPMCQYSCVDGMATEWHLVHLGSRAVGGAGLIFTEASAVTPEGRITPGDLGIWSDAQVAPLKRITDFVHGQGSYAGIQLAHAGRKASMSAPWEKEHVVTPENGGWTNVLAPSAVRFSEAYPQPIAMDAVARSAVTKAFADAARRARSAGFDVVEIHAAHGYLLHEFLSPASNLRMDEYGGSFANRARLLLEVTDAVRAVWPERLPLFVRISASDWMEAGAGWDLDQSVELATLLKARGVDLIDVSSGGNLTAVQIPVGPGYQVGFAQRIRRETGMRTGAVGMITDAAQADQIIRTAQADVVLLAREMLRNPYWPLQAARELKQEVSWPVQYQRAAAGRVPARAAVTPAAE